MLSIPPSVFFGKRATRAQAKAECTQAVVSTRASKAETKQAAALQKSEPSGRQLRSQRSAKTSKKASDAAALSTPPPPPKTQGSQRAWKTPLVEKSPVYRQVVAEPAVVKTSPGDEYEFQVETPEGMSKKTKKRQPRQKNKTLTLWGGLAVKANPKPKIKSAKKVVIQEPENIQPVKKIVQSRIESKDAQPSLKKTPPLQERVSNTVHSSVPSKVGGLPLGNSKRENFVIPPSSKTNSDKSASEHIPKQVNLKSKQVDGEAKENNPVVNMKNMEPPTVLQTSSRKSNLSAIPECTPAKSLISSTNNISSVGSSELSPPAMNNMSLAFSPIHGSAKSSTQSLDQSRRGNSIHASTPFQPRKKLSEVNTSTHNETTQNETRNKKTLEAATSIQAEESAQCISSAASLPLGPPEDFEDHHSSGAVSDGEDEDSQDLYNPDILEDLQNIGKPSIPERLLGGRKPTMFRGSKLSQVNHFRRQGTGLIFPEDKTDSCWRIYPTTKYIYSYEPSLDDCFGFDDGPDAYAIKIRQPVVERRPFIPPERPPPPIPEKQVDEEPQPRKESRSKRKEPVPCLIKTCLRSQTKLGEPRASLTDMRIDEMLSRSKKSFANESSIFDSITSLEETEASSSSELSDVAEDSNASSKQQPPLFEDFQMNTIYTSPFTQPPRRSYAHLRPAKRVFAEEEEEDEEPEEESRPKTSKPNKTVHKRKKMVQSTMKEYKEWAKDLSSHFAEVDDVELITE